VTFTQSNTCANIEALTLSYGYSDVMQFISWTALMTLALKVQTPTPAPVAPRTELEAGLEAMRTFRDFTMPMAILFVVGLSILVVGLFIYLNRNRGKEFRDIISTLTDVIRDERAEKISIREDANEHYQRMADGLIPIGDALNRTADNGETLSKLLQNMITAEANQNTLMTEIKQQLDRFDTEGTTPLKALAADVKVVLDYIKTLDTPPGNWATIFATVPEIRSALKQMNERLDEVLSKAREDKRRSSQQLPAVQVAVGESVEVQAVTE
jgi:hypothetical protein